MTRNKDHFKVKYISGFRAQLGIEFNRANGKCLYLSIISKANIEHNVVSYSACLHLFLLPKNTYTDPFEKT